MASDLVTSAMIDALFRAEYGKVLATVVRLVKNLDLAEDAVQEAFLAAAQHWPVDGKPEHPVAWLISCARFKAIDHLRRQNRLAGLQHDLARHIQALEDECDDYTGQAIRDDQLRLILACCHPALDLHVQTALTLRELCGLTTEAIAAAFLISPATMAQRIVRGKAKVRDAGIPFHIPGADELPQRIEAVLAVCYLVFNEGYSASSGTSHTRPDVSGEAIRLGRLLCDLCSDGEVFGLLALMLLHESRRETRTTSTGDIVLLEAQDRSRWNHALISEARQLLARAMAAQPIGRYTIQAAISAVHAAAPIPAATDWAEIVRWYDLLAQAAPSPVVELNRAVAIAMCDGPEAGLKLLMPLQIALADYHLFHAAKGDLLRRVGRSPEAAAALRRALALTQQEPERRLLERKLAELA